MIEFSMMEPVFLLGDEGNGATDLVAMTSEMMTTAAMEVYDIRRMTMRFFFSLGVPLLFWVFGLGSPVTCVHIEELERLERGVRGGKWYRSRGA